MLELTIRLIVSLAIVVGLLLLLARFTSRRFGSQKGALVQVVHRQPLSRTSAVSVVSIGSRVLVIGSTEQKVNLLAELDPAELEELSDPSEDTTGGTVLELVPAASEEQPVAVPPVTAAPVTIAPAPAPVLTDDLTPAEIAMLLGDVELGEDPEPEIVSPRPAEPVATSHKAATKPARKAARSHKATGKSNGSHKTPERTGRRATTHGRRTTSASVPDGALSGSILSPQTWRQAISTVTGKAS